MPSASDLASYVTRSLVKNQKLTYALLDAEFRIAESAPNFSSFLRAPHAQKGVSIFQTLDALVGAEDSLKNVLLGKEDKYQIEYIDFAPPGQPAQYISFYCCAAPPAWGGGLLLIVMDMTSPALIERRAVQARNELLLMRSRWEAKKAFLLRQAFYDPLTELPNRKYFEQVLSRYLRISQTAQTPCALIMIDVDDFKRINDSLGHLAGDETLRFLARIIRESIRKTDFPARYAGDEFCVIAPFLDADGARQVAERIQNALAQESAATLSIGIAAYLPPESPQQFLQRADQALYAAKRAGKNCARVYREGE